MTEPCLGGESFGSGVNFITVLAITYQAYRGPIVVMRNILLTNSSPALGKIILHAFFSVSGEIFFLLYATTNGQSDRVVAAETPISLYSIEKSLFINHLP